jgi:SAM-dependent methyltransferase
MKTCPFCNKEFEKFNPFGHTAAILREVEIIGGGGRPDALCPGCGSLDRERLIYLYLREETNLLTTQKWTRVLHIAPAPRLARVIRAAPARIHYISAALESGKAMVQVDLTDTQFIGDWFDVILCVHVLEHIEDDAKAMAELYRVLRPGGWALLQVPLSRKLTETLKDPEARTPEQRYAAYGQQDHVCIYAERDYVKRLRAAGFQVEFYNAATWLGPDSVRRYGLDHRETLYIGYKGAR